MDIKTLTLGNVPATAFNKAVGYFKRSAKTIKTHFENGVIYGVAAVFATGDYAHINKLLPALELAGLEPKFRRTVVAHGVVPFKYDRETCQFVGKIQPGRRAALEMLNTDGIPQWEVVLRAALDGELPENKDTPVWKAETRLPNLIKACFEHGYDTAAIRKLVNEAIKEYAPATPVQEVKEGIKQDKQDRAAEAANLREQRKAA